MRWSLHLSPLEVVALSWMARDNPPLSWEESSQKGFVMSRFSKLPLLLLLVIPTLLLAQENIRPGSTWEPWLNDKLTLESPDDDELQKLLKARYREATEELRVLQAIYLQSPGQDKAYVTTTLEALDHLKTSALDLCHTRDERVAVWERMIKHLEGTESIAKARHEAAVATAQDIHRVRYMTLDARIHLLRVKQEKPGSDKP
jgi:hypothetical protein